MITGYDHVQVAVPAGSERECRDFYGNMLGMTEVPKPPGLAARGGCWFRSGSAVLHLGVEEPFHPATKAHPAFVVSDLTGLRARLTTAGFEVVDGADDIPGIRRIHSYDPFGNRLEFQQG